MRGACYVVRWGDVWKVGYTADRRWRTFVNRGAELVNVTIYENALDALRAESVVEYWLATFGVRAFSCKADAAPFLGNQGGGWTECYLLPGRDRITDSLKGSLEGSVQ